MDCKNIEKSEEIHAIIQGKMHLIEIIFSKKLTSIQMMHWIQWVKCSIVRRERHPDGPCSPEVILR
jgi:hypothetical protein